MSIRIDATWYRGLRKVEWTPEGVTALVGQNGAGKSTLLQIPVLLREMQYQQRVRDAVELVGGIWGLRHFETPEENSPLITLCSDQSYYGLTFRRDDEAVTEAFHLQPDGPIVFQQGNVVRSEAPDGTETAREPWARSLLAYVIEKQPEQRAAAEALMALIREYRLYRRYALESIQLRGSQSSSDRVLAPDGQNVFALLRNWRDVGKDEDRFEFVLQGLRRAFGDAFRRFDFEFAQSVVFAAFQDQRGVNLPARAASEGMLTLLLHLCAVASAPQGAMVAIDEPENALSPFAIRVMLELFRERAAAKDLTILLATHSPALLNHFRDEPENVWVLDPRGEKALQRLTDLHDEAWLDRFSIGDLYAREVVGAPSDGTVNGARSHEGA